MKLFHENYENYVVETLTLSLIMLKNYQTYFKTRAGMIGHFSTLCMKGLRGALFRLTDQ